MDAPAIMPECPRDHNHAKTISGLVRKEYKLLELNPWNIYYPQAPQIMPNWKTAMLNLLTASTHTLDASPRITFNSCKLTTSPEAGASTATRVLLTRLRARQPPITNWGSTSEPIHRALSGFGSPPVPILGYRRHSCGAEWVYGDVSSCCCMHSDDPYSYPFL